MRSTEKGKAAKVNQQEAEGRKAGLIGANVPTSSLARPVESGNSMAFPDARRNDHALKD